MVNSLELILGEISKAEVKLGKNTGRVALNLFEYQEVIELSFNGHKSLQAYDHYCESLLQRLKDQIDERLAEVDARQVVVQDINLLVYEVTSQEKRYFPRKCPEDWFLKLQFQIRHQKEQFRDEVVRESILRYIKLQQRLLERAKELLRHRKSFLKNSSRVVSDTTRRSTPPLVSDHGQVEMFQEPAYKTPLVWNRSSSDLLEVLIAIHRSNAISLTTGPIAQNDLIDLFSRFLNKPIKHTNQSLSALKRRKKPETSYTLELHQQYRFYCDDV